MISFIISCSPDTVPCSVTVAFGYCSMAVHGTPKVEQVMQMPLGFEVASNSYVPSMAWYGMQVSKGMPRPSSDHFFTSEYAPVGLPPSHEPAVSAPLLRMTWMARLISGPSSPAALRAILMRSASDDMVP